MNLPYLESDFTMATRFNLEWNPHYDFASEQNRSEIERNDVYDPEADMNYYQSGGGDVIPSPWGSNKALDAGKYAEGHIYTIGNDEVVNPQCLAAIDPRPTEFCSKELIVNPGNMLSLQRHRGRQEYWAVQEGTLTVVLDGVRHDVPAGKAIFIPQGAAHCMINVSEQPVKVIELQTGICRENDNIRLVDFSGRPTYPLTSEVEFESAKLYARIQREIVQKFHLQNNPHPALLCA
ncbi:MAG: phosphomannose isomerase type II C-terminal cupin domain [Pseudobdellovibrionaceae bacterium]